MKPSQDWSIADDPPTCDTCRHLSACDGNWCNSPRVKVYDPLHGRVWVIATVARTTGACGPEGKHWEKAPPSNWLQRNPFTLLLLVVAAFFTFLGWQ